jgi:putative methyltransferase (TIGR04325 family)
MSLSKAFTKLIQPSKKKKINKEYENYSVAIQFCTNDAYQNIELCNMIADKTSVYIETLKKKPHNLSPTNVFLLAAINQYIIDHSKNELTVLDFGGACGAHYFEMKRFIPNNISLKWYVVETEQMVKSAIAKGLQNNELKFISSIEDANDSIDFIHSSSALQYVPNPYQFTEMLINLKADRIFFNRMMFNESDRGFVTIQQSLLSANGPGKMPEGYTDKIISYPHTTISLPQFDTMFADNNYAMDWIFDEPSGSYKIKNEKIIGKGLLYVKK